MQITFGILVSYLIAYGTSHINKCVNSPGLRTCQD